MADSYIDIKSFETFSSTIDSMAGTINQISELFDSQNKLFAQLENSDYWQSTAGKKLIERYNLLKNNYETIINSLKSYHLLAATVHREYLVNDELRSNELDANSAAYSIN